MKRTLIAFTVLVSGLLSVATGASASTGAVPQPKNDPFYQVPSDLAHLTNGSILRTRSIRAYADGLPIAAHAWQILYKTLSPQNSPTATVATILLPNARWHGPGRRPLVSYDLAEDGVGLRCTPSYALRAGLSAGGTVSAMEVDYGVPQLIARGWGVVLPDYEGPQSEFASAPMAAHGILDGIRAARRFTPAGMGGATPLALFGYSGGGFATAAAALAQRSYAPELHFRGIAMGGVPGDIRAVYDAAAGGAAGGATMLILTGLARANPAAHLYGYLDTTAKSAASVTSQDCLADAIAHRPLFNLNQHMTAYGLQIFRRLMRNNSPLFLTGSPTAPVFQYHAQIDELVPYNSAVMFEQRLCRAGVRVDFAAFPGGEHVVEQALGDIEAISYLADRFAGKPAPTTCG